MTGVGVGGRGWNKNDISEKKNRKINYWMGHLLSTQEFSAIKIIFYLNLSCPAVSHICSFTDLPPILTILEPNSTPIVWWASCLTKIIKYLNTADTYTNASSWKNYKVVLQVVFIKRTSKVCGFAKLSTGYIAMYCTDKTQKAFVLKNLNFGQG